MKYQVAGEGSRRVVDKVGRSVQLLDAELREEWGAATPWRPEWLRVEWYRDWMPGRGWDEWRLNYSRVSGPWLRKDGTSSARPLHEIHTNEDDPVFGEAVTATRPRYDAPTVHEAQ